MAGTTEMPKLLSDARQAMIDAVNVRDVMGSFKHSLAPEEIAHHQMWHLECCVQALIEEIRKVRGRIEDGIADALDACAAKRPIYEPSYAKTETVMADMATEFLHDGRKYNVILEAKEPGDIRDMEDLRAAFRGTRPATFPDPATTGSRCDNCGNPMQIVFDATMTIRRAEGEIWIVICNHCKHIHASWLKQEKA